MDCLSSYIDARRCIVPSHILMSISVGGTSKHFDVRFDVPGGEEEIKINRDFGWGIVVSLAEKKKQQFWMQKRN